MRDDPLPRADEAVALLAAAADLGLDPARDPDLACIVEELARFLPLLRRQEWGHAV